jgi:DNA helicase-2/ATP-dependent DNA helicase PcrA
MAEKNYFSEYNKLNPEQKAAVDYIDGPLLVIAGPGTGKTQLLSLRVANILKSTDSDASSILCLTFTNFAATNMRERLRRLVGSAASNVQVKTFHSFAGDIIQSFPDYFWSGARLGLVPDAAQLEIIQSILTSLPFSNPLALKFGGNYTAISDVQAALKLTKEAGLTPDRLRVMIEQNINYIDEVEEELANILSSTLSIKKLEEIKSKVEALPDHIIEDPSSTLLPLSEKIKSSLLWAIGQDEGSTKTKHTGKWKRDWVQNVQGRKGMYSERSRNEWWLALCDIYASYRSELHGRGFYDYSDMIIEVITQLEKHPELLAEVQEKYLYLLIDEFQDANAAQMQLANLVVSNPVNEDKPNLMAVGDDDQSIYAFNGAELNNMLRFGEIYPATKTVVLTDNYRSTQEVLDIAETIIEQSSDRLSRRDISLVKKLKAKTELTKGVIEARSYPTQPHQIHDVSLSIKQTWDSDPNQKIAVLARGHESLRKLSAELNRLDVPIRYERQNDVFEQPLVKQVIMLARLIQAISTGDIKQTNYVLSRLLAIEPWRIEAAELWQLAIDNRGRDSNWLNSLAARKDKKLINLHKWLTSMSQEALNQPLNVMVEYILGLKAGETMTSPIRGYFLDLQVISSEYLEGLSALKLMNELVSEFTSLSTVSPKLSDLIKFVNLNTDLGKPITDESWFVSGNKAVDLMTVHKAKGLEFDTVYIIDGVEKEWQPKHRGRKSPANLPLQPYGEHQDDYARLAYVAATRAKRNVLVSGFYSDSAGQEVLMSQFYEAIDKTKVTTNDNDTLQSLESEITWPLLQSKDSRSLLTPILDRYELTATGFLQFLDVSNGGPHSFLQRQILRLPDLTTDSMAYGTAMHKAMQVAQETLNTAGKLELDKVIDSYIDSLEKQPLSDTSLQKYRDHGQNILNEIFDKFNFQLPIDGRAEVKFSDIRIGNAKVNGALDHLYVNGTELMISDYKTGKPLDSFTTKAKNKAIKAWRHKTQLQFYCLLAGASGRYKSASSYKAQIVYLEAESDNELVLSLNPSPEDVKRTQELINAIWQLIISGNFPDTKDYEETVEGITDFENDLLKGKFKV